MKCFIFLFCFLSLEVKAQVVTIGNCDDPTRNLDECASPDQVNWTFPCQNQCSRTFEPKSICNLTICCQYGDACYSKPPLNILEPSEIEEFYENVTREGSDTEGRNFNFGVPQIPPIFPGGFPNPISPLQPLCPQSFPNNCPYNPLELFQLETFVNIPYCQRIACNSSNPFLDNDPHDCFNVPGCVYDRNLAFYRNIIGHVALPGVPVCHLAIRNQAFLRRAQEIIVQYGSWNPYLTNCVIDQYSDEIYGDDAPGCKMLDLLTYFGHLPKLAGWNGITSAECALIGACWKTNFCAYPVKTNQGNPNLHSYNDDDTKLLSADLYGQPVCQNFNPLSTGAEYLNGYHNCLRSGCAIQYNSTHMFQQLHAVGSGLGQPFRLYWLRLVYSGQVQPHNFAKVLLSFSNSQLLPISSTTLFNPIFYFAQDSCGPGISNPVNSFFLNNFNQQENFPPNFGLQPQSLYNPCPFQSNLFNFPGLPQLAGSFQGCCDKPACYIPKTNLHNARSGVSSYYGMWSCWSKCILTNDICSQTRRRECIGDTCFGGLTQQTQHCNPNMCPVYSHWGDWGHCSRSCGGGQARRRRTCSGMGCLRSKLSETRQCRTRICPTLIYGDWSDCSATCGNGVRTRTVRCLNGCPRGQTQKEEEACLVFCERSILVCSQSTCCFVAACSRGGIVGVHCPQNNILTRFLIGTQCFNCTPQSGCPNRQFG